MDSGLTGKCSMWTFIFGALISIALLGLFLFSVDHLHKGTTGTAAFNLIQRG